MLYSFFSSLLIIYLFIISTSYHRVYHKKHNLILFSSSIVKSLSKNDSGISWSSQSSKWDSTTPNCLYSLDPLNSFETTKIHVAPNPLLLIFGLVRLPKSKLQYVFSKKCWVSDNSSLMPFCLNWHCPPLYINVFTPSSSYIQSIGASSNISFGRLSISVVEQINLFS